MIVAIESPPGGGKGFLLKYLYVYAKYERDVPFRFETLHLDDNMSHMMDFNVDPHRWSFFTQADFLLKHYDMLQQAQAAADPSAAADVFFIEGSVLTDFHCHIQHMHDAGFLRGFEHDVLSQWFRHMSSTLPCVDLFVELKCDTQTHFERVVNNSKREQAYISLQHVKDMQSAYRRVVEQVGIAPVLTVHCPPCFEDNEPCLNAVCKQIVDEVEKHLNQWQRQHRSPKSQAWLAHASSRTSTSKSCDSQA